MLESNDVQIFVIQSAVSFHLQIAVQNPEYLSRI